MALWIIKAYEGYKMGADNAYEIDVIEGTEAQAIDAAEELSLFVMDNYSDIYEKLEADAEEIYKSGSPASKDKILAWVAEDNIQYDLYEVDIDKAPTTDADVLYDLFRRSPDKDAFIEKYCIV
jgi:hypothetical protein